MEVRLNPYYKTKEIKLKAQFAPTDSGFEITYTISGELDTVSFDKFSTSGVRQDELWKKTCLECFIKDQNSDTYMEFNFSPNGNYSGYQFDGLRKGMRNIEDLNVSLELLKEDSSQYVLKAAVELGEKRPFSLKQSPLGICAITEHKDKMEYWAILHPSSTPDFHCPEGFIIEI